MVLIKDELIYPYIIEVTDISLIVYQEGTTESGKEKKTRIGYYSNLFSALNKISKLKVMDKQESFTLKEYIEAYQNTIKELLDKFKDI